MKLPPPVILAREIAPAIDKFDWGIGGSVLMWSLGLEPAPRDLDIVTTVDDFAAIRAIVSVRLGMPAEVSHPKYQSQCFARFAADGPVPMDLFAGIAVRTPRGRISWPFDPRSVTLKDGLRWMRPADWVELYSMFDRPRRARALQAYLSNGTGNDARKPPGDA